MIRNFFVCYKVQTRFKAARDEIKFLENVFTSFVNLREVNPTCILSHLMKNLISSSVQELGELIAACFKLFKCAQLLVARLRFLLTLGQYLNLCLRFLCLSGGQQLEKIFIDGYNSQCRLNIRFLKFCFVLPLSIPDSTKYSLWYIRVITAIIVLNLILVYLAERF